MEATASELLDLRRRRRHPRRTQFDYLHLRELLAGLQAAIAHLPAEAHDVLDVYCGSRPYEDLFPAGVRYVGFDRFDHYGVADVVSDDFLPFEDASFDVVMCTEAFYYVPDPVQGVAELRRVLRPGGAAIITVPFMWEYDRTILEHRYTGPELAALFEGWDELEIVENGGRAVCWATLTGRLIGLPEQRLYERSRALRVLRPLFAAAYLVVNAIGAVLDRAERRGARSDYVLPMNLLVYVRRPRDD